MYELNSLNSGSALLRADFLPGTAKTFIGLTGTVPFIALEKLTK